MKVFQNYFLCSARKKENKTKQNKKQNQANKKKEKKREKKNWTLWWQGGKVIIITPKNTKNK